MGEKHESDIIANNTNHSPWVIFKNDPHDFDTYMKNLETKEETDTWVPDSVFFLLDTERNILLGAVNIRHWLKGELVRTGGHIGDGIWPSERRKGYATEMIRLALLECKKLGLDRVLMVCEKEQKCRFGMICCVVSGELKVLRILFLLDCKKVDNSLLLTYAI